MNTQLISKTLKSCYSQDLCYPKVKDDWDSENPTLGMCAITSLLVHDYLGGDIAKIKVDGISHYFNIIEGKIVDFTCEQFSFQLDYSNYHIVDYDTILTEECRIRYELLKRKFVNILLEDIDKEINNCQKCLALVEKFPDSNSVHLGINNDIVLIGEAPANNCWRKSHKVWHDINGNMLPSGKNLNKLFSYIDRDIMDTTFLECCKCFPKKRQSLKNCSANCHDFMKRQLEILNPKIIVTLGEFPTRIILNEKFEKFSDVVGNIYEIDGFKVLPLYHPSPISPLSYKGNVPFIEKLRDFL